MLQTIFMTEVYFINVADLSWNTNMLKRKTLKGEALFKLCSSVKKLKGEDLSLDRRRII